MRRAHPIVRTTLLTLLLAAAAGSACAHPPSAPAPPLPLAELAQSPLGSVTAPGREVVRDAAAWSRLWARMARDGSAPPAVDFERQIVLVAFMGERRTGGHAILIRAAELEDGALVVTVRETVPPPGAITTQMLTAPFHAVAVARTDLPVRWVLAR